MIHVRGWRTALFLVLIGLTALPVLGQQTGSISGRITTDSGEALPGVTIEAKSPVMPQGRVTTSGVNGDYRLPQLPPGKFTLTFTLSGMETRTRNVQVMLNQDSTINVAMGMAALSESITVAAEYTFVDPASTAIKSSLSSESITQLPVGQEYRDLVKLIPAVQYTEDSRRGPSAGGSGQDNMYQFDGVNVTLPLFGNLSAEPSTHDVQEVSVVKGGAKAIDFNRSGGFLIDTVSKSGSSEFSGQLSYQVQSDSMTGDQDVTTSSKFDQDRSWGSASLGGPLVKEMLYFYASYYRPESSRDNRSNLYGEVPDFESTRDELFGKVTFTPTSSILLHGSYRDSDREESGVSVTSSTSAGSTSEGGEAQQTIGILEGSWVVNSNSYVTMKATDFQYDTLGRPDNVFDFGIAIDGSVPLNISALDTQGLFVVPQPIAGQTAFNTFIQPLIDRYGYVENGVRKGGGRVGGASTFNNQDFGRQSFQLGYDYTIGSNIAHNLHVGYQWQVDEEDLYRTSNGWGLVEVIGGRSSFQGKPIYYQASFEQMTLGDSVVPTIHSEMESQNIDFNDTIRWGNWAFNVGVMLSEDTLYGQGLREDSSTLSGYVAAPGNKYEMYKVDFTDQIQPRVGVTWSYNGADTVYASYAVYNPAASTLPRAASWDRNLARTIRAYFDQDGKLFATDPVASSSGKLFDDDLDPRRITEYLIGSSRQLASGWTGRFYGRYRHGINFWEDTNNNARVNFRPPEGIPQELYIPDLAAKLAQIGSGSSYVIAELDNAFTKYYEATLESEYRTNKYTITGTYTWSHYYGNFDQDNSTTANDADVFIGSSFIADGAGRQIWDRRYGDLRGDRRHILKMNGYYSLPWSATTGLFAVYQSGQPWEMWSYLPYRDLTSNTSDVSRFAEPAGSRETDSHYQIDLNYTQNFRISGFNVQLGLDCFNVTDNQTGYNIQNQANSANFGVPRSYYDPRRFQVAARFQF